MMGTPRTGDKRAIQNICTSNSEQKEQTNKEKYIFYCSVSQIHINPEKNTKMKVFGHTYVRLHRR